ncbi:hypothetical protein ACQ4LE_005370 [Meloidogyne hapla]
MDENYLHDLLIILIQQSISIVGIIFNMTVVWVTFKHKNLQTSYGLLLSINCLCDAILESGTFLPTILVIMHTKIPITICSFATSWQNVLSGMNSQFNMLFISVDRIISLLFPVFYRFVLRKGAFKYVAVLNTFSLTFCLIFMVLGFNYALTNPDIKVYCNTPEQIGGDILSFGYYMFISVTLITVFNYISIGIIIKSWKSGDSDFQRLQTKRIYKSLIVIIFVIVFLTLTGVFCSKFIIPLLTNDPEMTFLYVRIFAQLVTISGAINAPVLYFCSSEYRNALNKEFPWIVKFFRRMPVIYPSTSIVTNVQVVTTVYPRQNQKTKF